MQNGELDLTDIRRQTDELRQGVDRDLSIDSRGRIRCAWCSTDPMYTAYHDTEWGRPVRDDRRLFEKICLEGFQCGLSWLTILKRREAFRRTFSDFDFDVISNWSTTEIDRLVINPAIIRHRGKIEATIHNADRAIEMRLREGSLSEFFWRYQPAASPTPRVHADIPVMTSESKAMSAELKKRGWKFVGPTTCYAFMQSMGIVNDHLAGCDWRDRPVS